MQSERVDRAPARPASPSVSVLALFYFGSLYVGPQARLGASQFVLMVLGAAFAVPAAFLLRDAVRLVAGFRPSYGNAYWVTLLMFVGSVAANRFAGYFAAHAFPLGDSEWLAPAMQLAAVPLQVWVVATHLFHEQEPIGWSRAARVAGVQLAVSVAVVLLSQGAWS